MKNLGIPSKGFELIKPKKTETGKYPIMKLENQYIQKIRGQIFENKAVNVEPYKKAEAKQEEEPPMEPTNN